MEDHLRLKKNPGNQQPLGTSEKIVSAQANQSQNLCDRFKSEMPNLSSADSHHKVTKNIKDISPKHSRNHHKQDSKAIKEEELVKYMSNLPSYLERGENRQEKFLNVGVLDWHRLEKWQCRHRQIPQKSNRHSLSSSNPSTPFFVVDSPAQSIRGQSCSPSRQRMRRPSLQCHLMASPPTESHDEAFKSLEARVLKFQDAKTSQAKTLDERGKFIRMGQTPARCLPETKNDQCQRRILDPKISQESEKVANGLNYEAVQQMKANVKTKAKTQDGEFIKRAGNFPEQKAYDGQKVSQKSETAVLLPKYFPQGNHAEVPQRNESNMVLGQRAAVAGRRSFSESPEEIGFAAVISDVPHSCPLPSELDSCSEKKWRNKNGRSYSFLPHSCQSVPHPAKGGFSASSGKVSEVKTSNIMAANSTLKEPSVRSDLKQIKVGAEKVRSTSPFRRLSIGMSKIGKSFSSKEVSSAPTYNPTKPMASFCQDTSNDDSQNSTSRARSSPLRRLLNPSLAKHGSESAMASFCQNASNGDAQNSTNRSRSSPLRRLLDPLLKPNVSQSHRSGEPLKNNLLPTDKVCNSSNVKLDSSTGTVKPGKVKLDVTSCRTTDGNQSQGDKCGLSAFQALLRVAVKNGLPLFTFAVDNETDILAATMKKLSSSREDECSCIYTFFAIQEVKKKNGRWINQGGKGKAHDYIPNVVAQLRVSGSQFSSLMGLNFMEQTFAREFVLFAVDLRQSEQQPLDSQPNDELAAIVVKIPKVTSRIATGDDHQTDKCNDCQEARYFNTYEGNVQNQPIIYSQSHISATVILPSGIHSLPSKGGPSSLIQRWRSGGSCDCGGWDLGCKLRILINQNQLSKKSSSSKACSTSDKFEFISQGGEDENHHVFSLTPFKDGIYSVEFISSLSILQAFALCIAVLDSKSLCESSDSGNLIKEKTSLETILAQNDGLRAANVNEGEIPVRYVSYPPHSPVGRV